MPEPKAFRRFAQAAEKWRDLVEKRSAHFVDLHKSGRWRLYYSEAEFLALLREAVELAISWAETSAATAAAPKAAGRSEPTAATEPSGASSRRPAA
jgi:uncharacterized repeat protein (TIGR03809 family)